MSSDQKSAVIRAFDAAAGTYDEASQVQREVARELVLRAAAQCATAPRKILDLGCGAGHVTEAALKRWPEADVCALDAAPAMLATLRAKFPEVKTLCRDAKNLAGVPPQDLMLSSMMLHWLPDPRAALIEWRKRLAPGGRLHVAVPVAGSLAEWRDLLRSAGLEDGLWRFPAPGFASDLCAEADARSFAATWPDAKTFLHSLKRTGAHKPRPGHSPSSPAALRRLLAACRDPFTATFRIEFLSLGASGR